MEVTIIQSTPNFPKNERFLHSDTHTYVCVSGGKKRSFFGKFGVLCLLVTSVLRFALLPYYRRNVKLSINLILSSYVKQKIHILISITLIDIHQLAYTKESTCYNKFFYVWTILVTRFSPSLLVVLFTSSVQPQTDIYSRLDRQILMAETKIIP